MIVESTPLDGVLVINCSKFIDGRGFFSELYNLRDFSKMGISDVFVQDNHSVSHSAQTVRGLHFQSPPHAQAKLIRCGRGKLFDVAVDIRIGSPTYGHWFGAVLSAENGRQLFIPAGFAHGFSTLAHDTEIVYRCSDYYAPSHEGAIKFDDPDLGIDWKLSDSRPIVSEKDSTASSFAELNSPFVYGSKL
jgi:dTDP-4-dehydrorhamnose 3,5-epimerase